MKQILVNEKNQIQFFETFSFHQKATGQQIIFKREKAKLSSSLLDIFGYQIWYQIKSNFMYGA